MSELRPTLLSRITKAVVLWLYRWKGWRLSGERKFPRKFVITGAPHTSNWDFIFFVGAVHELGIKPSFMGKVSLFRGPLKRFMYDMGGLPVDRSKRNNNYVEEAVAHFDRADGLALVVAPEGSRSSDGNWRTGFYRAAMPDCLRFERLAAAAAALKETATESLPTPRPKRQKEKIHG